MTQHLWPRKRMWLVRDLHEYKTLEDSWAISFKTKHEIIVCLAITLLGHLSQRNENVGSQKTSTWVFIEALLVAESVRLSFRGHSRRVTLWNTTQQCKETEQRQTTWTNLQGNTAEWVKPVPRASWCMIHLYNVWGVKPFLKQRGISGYGQDDVWGPGEEGQQGHPCGARTVASLWGRGWHADPHGWQNYVELNSHRGNLNEMECGCQDSGWPYSFAKWCHLGKQGNVYKDSQYYFL